MEDKEQESQFGVRNALEKKLNQLITGIVEPELYDLIPLMLNIMNVKDVSDLGETSNKEE